MKGNCIQKISEQKENLGELLRMGTGFFLCLSYFEGGQQVFTKCIFFPSTKHLSDWLLLQPSQVLAHQLNPRGIYHEIKHFLYITKFRQLGRLLRAGEMFTGKRNTQWERQAQNWNLKGRPGSFAFGCPSRPPHIFLLVDLTSQSTHQNSNDILKRLENLAEK